MRSDGTRHARGRAKHGLAGRIAAAGLLLVTGLAAAESTADAPADRSPTTAPAEPAERRLTVRERAAARAAARNAPCPIETRVSTVLEGVAEGDTPSEAAARLTELCDAVAAWAGPEDLPRIVAADAARRVLDDLARMPAGEGRRIAGLLAARPALLAEFAFLLRAEPGDRTPAYRRLAELVELRPRVAERAPALVAAVAAVHDGPTPYRRRINENIAVGSPAIDVLDYFARARGLALDPARTPAEVLVYVVDSAATVGELRWARGRFGRNPDVAECYADIDYDYDHYAGGEKKKVTQSGRYDLEAIRRHGGVCADQAHFAAHVGKAAGVATVYVRGRGAEVSHAWVGELLVSRRRAAWDFSTGRYEAYQNVRGEVTCPVSGRVLSDGELALIAMAAQQPPRERRTAAALAAAAERWRRALAQGEEPHTPPAPEGLTPIADHRGAGAAGRLELIELAVAASPHDAEAWRALAAMAEGGELGRDQLDRWCDALFRAVSGRADDFCFEIFAAMVDTQPDHAERSDMWDWAYRRFASRPDLATSVRLRQARLWRDAGDLDNAWRACDAVVVRFADHSPDTVAVAQAMLDLLERGDRRDVAAGLLERVWDATEEPASRSSFRRQSNWYRIGRTYAAELTRAGRARDARRVRDDLSIREDD